jgi:PKD repeat protein
VAIDPAVSPFSGSHVYADNGAYTVEVCVTDSGGATTCDQLIVTVNNVPPTLGAITPDPLDPVVAVNTAVGFSAPFSDPAGAVDESYDCAFDWDGDGTVDENISASYGACNASHAYDSAGIYTVKLTVADKDGGVSNESVYQYVVVYDPSAGFVTGGGWIDSPEDAYVADRSLTGKATFGFVSKYKKGAKVPVGNTEFQFHAGDLNFHSSSYEWLVVTGSDYARFKGIGTINGEGTYKFMLWAGDGDPDTFRIRIWTEDEATAVETDVYDNGFEGSGYETGQPISSGSIVVHTKKK